LKGWFVSTSFVARAGLSIFTTGFLLHEAVLFVQGAMFWFGFGMMPGYYWIMLLVSVPLPLGIFILMVHSRQTRRKAVALARA
ncbi:MAG TPA: hypothetical protein PLL18_10605, partial [Flavobacteriales bacterium]|nr:hypothetical protein [Flavobacteriales bacterium]